MYLLYAFLFIVLSAFFSASETAFFSLSKIQVKRLELQDKPLPKKVLRLLKKPKKLLTIILLGNTIANVAASTFAALFFKNFAVNVLGWESVPWWLLAFSVVLMTVSLIIFGELTPKLFAIALSEPFALFSATFLELINYILYPFIQILVFIAKIFTKKNDGQHLTGMSFTSEDLRNIVDSKPKHLPLNESEKRIISGIFKFTSTDIKKIMVPRVDVKSVSISQSLDSIKKEFINSGHSRLPVCKKNIDDLVGIVYAKDIILNPEIKSIKDILRKPIYVTENTKIQTLLNIFLAKKTHMAIVVDEYGGTSGIITLEDIVEELIGEIVDEYDKEQPLLVHLENNEYSASGMVSLTYLNQELNLDIDDEKYDNLAAFLYDIFNHVPCNNEQITYQDKALFIIQSVQGRRIEKVKIIILDNSEED